MKNCINGRVGELDHSVELGYQLGDAKGAGMGGWATRRKQDQRGHGQKVVEKQ